MIARQFKGMLVRLFKGDDGETVQGGMMVRQFKGDDGEAVRGVTMRRSKRG